jgi:hypothetical protein
MRRLFLLLALVAIVGTLGAAAIVAAGNGPLSPELQAVRAATAKYNDVNVAVADGYVASSPCESSPAGTMGIHYSNRSLTGPGLDPLHPEVLLYLPNGKGSLKLVGVEYFQADADQDKATDSDRPFLFGQGFQGPMDGHNPQMPIHYDLHVWVHESNPSGVFAQWNPAIHCP